MNRIKSLLISILAGGLAGSWVAAFIGAKVVTWNHNPGGVQAQCACVELSTSVSHGILEFEFWGLLTGAVVGLIVYTVVFARKKPAAPASPLAPA